MEATIIIKIIIIVYIILMQINGFLQIKTIKQLKKLALEQCEYIVILEKSVAELQQLFIAKIINSAVVNIEAKDCDCIFCKERREKINFDKLSFDEQLKTMSESDLMEALEQAK